MADHEPAPLPSAKPRLWNPHAAACWSLLFSPAFGAYLHAVNWRALGQPDRAAANMAWFWVVAAFLLLNLGTVFLSHAIPTDSIARLVGLGLMFVWFFTQGKPQTEYVKQTLQNQYEKKSWGTPLLVGAAALAAYAALIFGLAFVAYQLKSPAV